MTQRTLATYLVEHKAHYHFTVKGNQPVLERDIALLFATRVAPDFVEVTPPNHGRIETRRIWCSTALNAYLDFPCIGQAFLIERESIDKKTGVFSCETALGITSRSGWPRAIDWNYDEDRSQIRTGFGPENITRLRRFAVGILKSFQKPAQSIAEMMRKLAFRNRLVFDYLRMTKNSVTESRG